MNINFLSNPEVEDLNVGFNGPKIAYNSILTKQLKDCYYTCKCPQLMSSVTSSPVKGSNLECKASFSNQFILNRSTYIGW